MNKYNLDIKEMLNILNKKSGVLGISGVSSDFRDLDDAAFNSSMGRPSMAAARPETYRCEVPWKP